ncbi:hypothetical protein DV515_00012426 [Chloebia gouldiae]|uniref:Uncharacterized protein n=1 Tax=Chloebia gouldiae TaxID=44316 RepID=A0A3L8S4U1_CHLGU|nr:hypothetical protein DV515_00012426 [Chloebia gouldiae]
MARVRWSELIWSRSCGQSRAVSAGPAGAARTPPRPRAHRGLLGEHLLHHHVHEPLPLLMVAPLLLQDRLHPAHGRRKAPVRPRWAGKVPVPGRCAEPRGGRQEAAAGPCPSAVSESGAVSVRPDRVRVQCSSAGLCPSAVSDHGSVSEPQDRVRAWCLTTGQCPSAVSVRQDRVRVQCPSGRTVSERGVQAAGPCPSTVSKRARCLSTGWCLSAVSKRQDRVRARCLSTGWCLSAVSEWQDRVQARGCV